MKKNQSQENVDINTVIDSCLKKNDNPYILVNKVIHNCKKITKEPKITQHIAKEVIEKTLLEMAIYSDEEIDELERRDYQAELEYIEQDDDDYQELADIDTSSESFVDKISKYK